MRAPGRVPFAAGHCNVKFCSPSAGGARLAKKSSSGPPTPRAEMGNDDITRLSRREHALYGELAALYRGIFEALTDERAPVDLHRLAADGARAEAVVAALAV